MLANTLNIYELTGAVLLNGEAASDQCVMVLSADMDKFVTGAITDEDGNYKIELPYAERGKSVVLVVKIQGPVLALEHRVILPGTSGSRQDFAFNTAGKGFSTLQGTIVSDDGYVPPTLEIAITPIHLNDVPQPVENFFLRRDAGVVDASFYEKKITPDHFELRVQNGSYRISGVNIIYQRPVSTLQAPNSFIVDSVYADSETVSLPGEPMGGFILDIRSDRKISMHLKRTLSI